MGCYLIVKQMDSLNTSPKTTIQCFSICCSIIKIPAIVKVLYCITHLSVLLSIITQSLNIYTTDTLNKSRTFSVTIPP